MIRDIYNIDLEIPNSGIFIKGLDNEKLTISLDLVRFMQINKRQIVSSGNKLDVGKLAKPLNPYIIYNILEENNKNNFNDVKIIDKIEDNNNIVYHFNFGLILNTFIEKSKITRQMEQNTSDNLKDLNEIKAFIAPCFFSYGMVGDVKSIPKNELEDLENDYGYEGKDYKSIFKKEVYINFSCYERVYFSNCEFKSKVSLHIIDNDNTVCFLNGMDFSNCIFEDEINFKRFISGTSLPENKYYNNEQDTLFKNCIFKKRVVFHNSNFFNSIYFNNSHFKDYVDFHECEFKKTACFYGVRFDKTPNFSQAIFKENLNVVNTNLNFTFGNLQERIKQEYKDFNETKEKKSLDKFANDFRDSFRTFKNALIKDNNLLDASKFHKYELYCKEIELKFKKSKIFSREWMDKWQLVFYRKLCDHHTDILQSLNSLILVIGIFVLSSVVMVFGFNYSLGYKPILEHWYFSLDFYNHHINSIIQDNYLFVVKVNFAMLFGYLILVGFALCLKYIREFFIIISYAITLLVLVVSPKILIPAMGFFTDKRAMLDPLSTMGGIYTIVFGFVVFSFIKTIRKNSIVPS
ncbi:pentapeptide repeat-containing protein [Campylobacter sp. US33a]|uniref:pentapeptide repeat-containing protein n=1 Tax=Campylobacter sp. US33a TaxID=2498120 RepID=UPI001067B8B2|nr:pentapeptide repeat-containing protein [Campylobacter sp. US33a]TEY03882.1 pentapeptide repeat-containing protein [Campylobacter sp. US33a]